MKTSKKLVSRKKRHSKIRSIIKGTENRPRLIVSRSTNNHYVQLIDDEKGITIASATDLKNKEKGKKIDKAKDLGIKIASLAKEKNITKVVFDRGGHKYHGRVKAVADGAREGGLNF